MKITLDEKEIENIIQDRIQEEHERNIENVRLIGSVDSKIECIITIGEKDLKTNKKKKAIGFGDNTNPWKEQEDLKDSNNEHGK